jgi:hypothetical protein
MAGRATAIVLASLVTAGCAGPAIEKGMNTMLGQPLSAAVAKLGMPTDEKTIAGQKVYIWFNRVVDEGSEYKCTLRAIVSGDVITAWDFDGNNGPCLRYAERLSR